MLAFLYFLYVLNKFKIRQFFIILKFLKSTGIENKINRNKSFSGSKKYEYR